MTKHEIDYAAALAELEDILARLQDSQTSLDEAIKLHEKGKGIVVMLKSYLEEAEVTVKRQVAGE